MADSPGRCDPAAACQRPHCGANGRAAIRHLLAGVGYLADALSQDLRQYGPAADIKAMVADARQQYLDVLARDAGNKHAMQGMMAL
jgi:hypothetical protein